MQLDINVVEYVLFENHDDVDAHLVVSVYNSISEEISCIWRVTDLGNMFVVVPLAFITSICSALYWLCYLGKHVTDLWKYA